MGSGCDVQGQSGVEVDCLPASVSPPRMGVVAAVMYDGMRRARPPGQGSLIMPDPPCLLAQSVVSTGKMAEHRRR